MTDAGFAVLPAVLSAQQCDEALTRLQSISTGAGSRCLLEDSWCCDLAAQLQEQPAVAALVPESHAAIQCTYFDKSPERNWLVAIHQDLSVPVAERIERADLSGWSSKEGQVFVQAPVALLEQIVALRVHLDDCGEDNGPLRVVPSSHRSGVLSPEQALKVRADHGEIVCTAARGGVLAMRPLLLHASSKAISSRRRRVLHFVFAPIQLGYGLRWPDLMRIHG